MNLTLTLHGLPVSLVSSCLGDEDTGGGLLYHDGAAWIAIDNVTTGLYVSDNELARMLWAPSQASSGTSILHYTSDGLARTLAIDGFTDPHDVLWDGKHYVAVSSHQNAVVWVDPPNDVLYGTAFGRSDRAVLPAHPAV